MGKKIIWKLALIGGAIVASFLLIYPPEEKINLGLDLQGGSHLVLKVDTSAAVKGDVDLQLNRIGQGLKESGIPYATIANPEGTHEIVITGVDAARSSSLREILQANVPTWDVGNVETTWTIRMPEPSQREIEASAVEQTLTVLRQRVDELGVKEPIIQKQGSAGDRIVVELPGIKDPEAAKDILQDQAKLEWKAVVYPQDVTDFERWFPGASREATLALFGGAPPAGTELVPQYSVARNGTRSELWWPLQVIAPVVGNDLRSARRNADQLARPVVDFTLSAEAGRRFKVATRENLHRHMAIVMASSTKKEVISCPVIQSEISDRGQITGNFDIKSAENLALKLRSGAIPAAVSIIEERTVGPSLGRDSVKAGVMASLLGFAGITIFMLIWYRLSGLNAVIALFMNVVLVLGAMAYLGATLTLPGIAGLILTVGMAVDSNVLIFERIREELRIGKTVRSAIEQGFSRAFGTIIDTHVTTIVSALFLLGYGTGPVKGFAVTLIAGLLCSVFTAVFVSRFIYDLVLGERRNVESLSI